MATAYNDVPYTAQLTAEFIAGSSGVTKKTFVSIDGNTATTATSGHALIALNTAAEGAPVTVVVAGMALLSVNANSTNISGGTSKLMPTTGGLGIVAETTKDDYSAVALGDSTTDADVIRVYLAHGTENI
jgi:hypothetical protein